MATRSPRRRHANRTAGLLGLAAVLFLPVLNAETWQIGDRRFENVRVSTVTDATVTIFHTGGITQLEMAELPAVLQSRFGYDPEKAAQWRETAERGREATRRLEQQALETQKKRLAQAARPEPTNAFAEDIPVENFEILPKVDLRPLYRQHGIVFKDQGRRPSCSVFAVVGALEFEYARTYGRSELLSEEFLIWAVRDMQPGIPIDDGFHFREVISALQTRGIARQAAMPNTFGVKLSDIKPNADALADASTRSRVVPVWYRTNDKYLVARIINALNHHTPVVIGIRWPHPRTLRNNHILRDQQPLANSAHAVTIVGYESPERTLEGTVFIFRNSYGTDWGLGGCGLLSLDYLHRNTLAAFHLMLPGTAPTPAPDPESTAKPAATIAHDR